MSRKDDEERSEPSDGLTHLEEDEGAERGQDAPQADPAGRKETADEHHPDRRREQDVEELHVQEEVEVPGSREDHQRAERDGEVDERHDAHQRAEAEVEADPHERNGQDQDGEQDEQRLLLARFLVVPGVRADPSEGRGGAGDPTHPRSGSVRSRDRGVLGHERPDPSTGVVLVAVGADR